KPREVVLTDLGEILLERGDDILKLVEDTYSLLSDARLDGRIRLGTIPTVAPYFWPGLLRPCSELHPDISIVVPEDTIENLLNQCRHGEIDLAILALPVIAKYLEIEALFEEELLLVIPEGHALSQWETITPEVIEDYPFVMLN